MFLREHTAMVSFSNSITRLYSFVFSRKRRTALETEEIKVSCFEGSIVSELTVLNVNLPVVVWSGDSNC